MYTKITQVEASRRDDALKELENAIHEKNTKYMKQLIPHLRPRYREYDINSNVDEVESNSSFETERPTSKRNRCCCFW